MWAHHRKLQSLRRKACAEQGGLCFYCLQRMGRDVTAEHLVARVDGGRDTRANIVAACRQCNASRHALFPDSAPDPETFQSLVLIAREAGLWPIERP